MAKGISNHSQTLLDAKNCSSSCAISPTVSLADVEKAAFRLVGKLKTGVEKVVRETRVIAGKLITGTGAVALTPTAFWHNDCPKRRKRTVEINSQDLSARTSSLRANRVAMRLVSMLIAVPLWLMIVLLSPLDTYVAAKSIAKRA